MVSLCFHFGILLNSKGKHSDKFIRFYIFGGKAGPFKMIGSLTNVVKTKNIIILNCTLIKKMKRQ